MDFTSLRIIVVGCCFVVLHTSVTSGEQQNDGSGSWTTWTSWSSCSTSTRFSSTSSLVSCFHRKANFTGPTNCPDYYTKDIICPANSSFIAQHSLYNWHSCNSSLLCEPAVRSRSRSCDLGDLTISTGEEPCLGPSIEVKSCGYNICPDSLYLVPSKTVQSKENGSWTEWSAWSTCTSTCGPGTRSRSRSCNHSDVTNIAGPDPCVGPMVEVKTCEYLYCPVDGFWVSWRSWYPCSRTCGGGTRSRVRHCAFSPRQAPHGATCPGSAIDLLDCNTQLCPVDGKWTRWTAWEACSVSCGIGTKARTRVCAFDAAAPRGNDCYGANNETIQCSEQYRCIDSCHDDFNGCELYPEYFCKDPKQKPHCRKSCNLCTHSCHDDFNGCELYPEYFCKDPKQKPHCRKSCNLCTPNTATTSMPTTG